MTASGNPANSRQLSALLKKGEGVALEFKRSTGEIKEGMQTLCAFLNSSGGTVLFGVRPDGAAEGQEVSTRRSATSRKPPTASSRPPTSRLGA
jgi:predicted HTH transcriptional regulator